MEGSHRTLVASLSPTPGSTAVLYMSLVKCKDTVTIVLSHDNCLQRQLSPDEVFGKKLNRPCTYSGSIITRAAIKYIGPSNSHDYH